MKLLVVFGLIGVLLLAGCCGPVSGTASEKTATPTGNTGAATGQTPSATNIKNGEIGKTYSISYLGSEYEVTLTNTTFTHSTLDYNTNYLMAYFEIKNIGDKSEMLSPTIYALDASGEKYDSTIGFGLADKYDKTLDLFKQLPPNTKMSGWTAIEVPENTKQFDLYFEYSNVYLSETPSYIKWSVTR